MKNLQALATKLILFSCFQFDAGGSFAQEKTVIMINDTLLVKKTWSAKSGILITNPFLNNFVGTWEGSQNDEVLTLIATKTTLNAGSAEKPLEIEMLNGGYRLIINGKESLNTLETKPLFGNSENNANPVLLKITNLEKNTQNAITLYLIDENTIKLEAAKLTGEGVRPDPDFYLPTGIILNKKINTLKK